MTKKGYVFQGVNANSWFSLVDGHDLTKHSQPQTSVHAAITSTVRKRASSASAILGRRHYEIEKQELKHDEVLRGKQLRSRSSFHSQSSNETHDTAVIDEAEVVKNSQPKSKRSTRRPKTSPGMRSHVYQPETDTCDLVITALSLHASRARNIDNGTENSCASANKSPLEIKFEFKGRVKSAPAALRSSEVNLLAPERTHTPYYWKTRDSFHRKQLMADNDNDDEMYSHHGSSLRSLLQRSSGDLKHSAGCPYKCRGCFRACLASDDYLEAMKDKRTKPCKTNSHGKPVVRDRHRKLMAIALGRSQPMYRFIKLPA